MLSSVTEKGRGFKLFAAHLHGNRPGLITLSVIITDLGVFLAKVNTNNQVPNLIHPLVLFPDHKHLIHILFLPQILFQLCSYFCILVQPSG